MAGHDLSLSTTAAESNRPGRTLLPRPLAQAVSLATRSSCLAIRIGSTAGAYGLDAAKFTTVSSLELARGVVAGVLSRAGKDTLTRSNSDLAREDAESIIERSLENLHRAVTHAVFWTTASFQLTNTTFSMASSVSQLFLSTLDQLFGSTDSSRAIASIVTLIRRELTDPSTGFQGEKVGAIDLVLGICALAYLQGRTWRSTSERLRRQEYEEIIWDVVVLDDGERVDVNEQQAAIVDVSQEVPTEESEPNAAIIERGASSYQGQPRINVDDGDQIIELFKEQITSSLPPDSTVSISSSVSTVRTIVIDVDSPEPFLIPAIPGAEVVETKLLPSQNHPGQQSGDGTGSSLYRVVYRLDHKQVTNTSISHHDEQHPSAVELPSVNINPPNASSPQLTLKETPEPQEDSRSQKALPTIPVRTSSNTTIQGNVQREKGSHSSIHNITAQPSPDRPDKSALPSQRRPSSRAQSQRSAPGVDRSSPNQEANQKKPRVPLERPPFRYGSAGPSPSTATVKKSLPKRKIESTSAQKTVEKKGGLKQAFKGSSQSISNIWHKDPPVITHNPSSQAAGVRNKARAPSNQTKLPVSGNHSRVPSSSHLSAPGQIYDNSSVSSGPSRASWISVHERRRDSVTSQTDRYSIHSACGNRPSSAAISAVDEALDTHQADSPVVHGSSSLSPPSPSRGHRRNVSHGPSLYSLGTNDSQASLVLASYYQKSVFNASDALSTLRRDGTLDGMFPHAHLLRNIARYMRFSSASYGSSFMKLLGISKDMPGSLIQDDLHSDVRHFVHHTQSQTDSVLLTSFIDPHGGTDSSGSTGRGVPLVHYISLDHEARAVVLACRGTLGFEDVLADMACDYDALVWQNRSYQVHKGVHASARRLLHGDDGRVMVTLREALLEFPDYGVILCGHSLGGAVTSLFGVMLSEPNPNGTGFVTVGNSLKHQNRDANNSGNIMAQHCLPSGRPIQVYAYGPPGTMSPSLRKRTRGLITSIIHGNDVVPYLSLGVLHDFQTVALAFRNDHHQAMSEIRRRLWQALQTGITEKWYRDVATSPGEDDMEWGLSILQTLRSSMTNQKLVPPGELFTIESKRVLRRDAFLLADEEDMGRPAQRVVFKYVKDVEARFKEVRFGTSMLMDHSPANYEEALNKLRIGVVE